MLADLFTTEEFSAGQPTGSVRALSDTTALAWTYQEIKGQVIAGTDDAIPLRKNHSLAVLDNVHGEWLITAHMWMDENITE